MNNNNNLTNILQNTNEETISRNNVVALNDYLNTIRIAHSEPPSQDLNWKNRRYFLSINLFFLITTIILFIVDTILEYLDLGNGIPLVNKTIVF